MTYLESGSMSSSPSVSLVVLPRGKAISTLPPGMKLPPHAPTSDLYSGLAAASGTSVHRIRVTKGSDGQLIPNAKDLLLNSTGLLDGSKIYVKDLGQSIG